MALFVAGDYAGGLRKTIDLFALLAKDPELTLPEGLRRYLPLAIDLAAAHTPADVQTALESVAAPVGGWRRKHYQRTANLTGFVGLTGGYETPRNEPGRSAAPSGWATRAFASVGLDVSFPAGRTLALEFFVSALDLGQLTSSRLTSTVKGARWIPRVCALWHHPRQRSRDPDCLAIMRSPPARGRTVTIESGKTRHVETCTQACNGIVTSA